MLTYLKVSSLACKRVFYRPEQNAKVGWGSMELNFEGLELQRWNIPTGRAQRVDDKNTVICLAIMFTPGITIIKISHLTPFLYFLLMTANNESQFGQNVLVHLKDLTEFFQKIVWEIGSGVTGKLLSQKKYRNLIFSRIDILLMVAQNPIIHSIFWKSLMVSFRCT